MRTYEHRETDAGHNYEVWYKSESCQKKVAKDKPDYISWLSEGNTPIIIPYKSTEPESSALNVDLRVTAINKSIMRRTYEINKGFKFVVNGVELIFDTGSMSRELLAFAVQIVQSKPDTYTREIVLKDGSFVTLTKAEIISLNVNMLTYGETLYDKWLFDYKKLLVATDEQLSIYCDTWVI